MKNKFLVGTWVAGAARAGFDLFESVAKKPFKLNCLRKSRRIGEERRNLKSQISNLTTEYSHARLIHQHRCTARL